MKRSSAILIGLACVILATSVWAVPMETILNPEQGGRVQALGTSVAADGDWMVAGAPKAEYGGLAEVYHRDSVSGEWRRVRDLSPMDDRNPDQLFGESVAISSDTIVVGVDANRGVNDVESAYVFVRGAGDEWTRQAILTPSHPTTHTSYGVSVAVSGDLLAVGASPEHWSTGRVYVYERDGVGTWSETAVIEGPAGDAGERFGWSIALEGETLIVGAPDADDGTTASMGMVYVYERQSPGAWSSPATLVAPTAVEKGRFGSAVDLSGDSVIVAGLRSNPAEDTLALEAAGYVFVRQSPGTWSLQGSLDLTANAGDPYPGDVLADAANVAIDGDLAVVLAARFWEGGTLDSSLTFYKRDGGGTWGESDSPAYQSAPIYYGDLLPMGLDLSDGAAACAQSNGSYSESALLILEESAPDDWAEVARMPARWRADLDRFGRTIATAGETLFVGVPDGDQITSVTGTVYVYAVNAPTSYSAPAMLEPPFVNPIGKWGWALAASTDTLAVPSTLGGANILIYGETSPGQWTYRQTLTWPQMGATGSLGDAIAVSGDVLAALARAEEDDTDTYVAIYRRDGGGTWSLEQTLSEPTPPFGNEGDFGFSLAFARDVLFVGAPDTYADNGAPRAGAVHVYRHGGVGAWAYESTLVSPFVGTGTPPAAGMQFGWSIAAQPGMLLVGEPAGDTFGADAGAVHAFALDTGTSWTLQQTLTPAVPLTYSTFGCGLAMSGSSALVLAPFGLPGPVAPLTGYLFTYDGSSGWQEDASFSLPDGVVVSDLLAAPATLAKAAFAGPRTVAVGGPSDETQAFQGGAVYLFDIDAISQSAFESDQIVSMASDGQFYAMALNFAANQLTGDMNGSDSGDLAFAPNVNEWVGVYIYDYASGQWSEAMYVLRNRLE